MSTVGTGISLGNAQMEWKKVTSGSDRQKIHEMQQRPSEYSWT